MRGLAGSAWGVVGMVNRAEQELRDALRPGERLLGNIDVRPRAGGLAQLMLTEHRLVLLPRRESVSSLDLVEVDHARVDRRRGRPVLTVLSSSSTWQGELLTDRATADPFIAEVNRRAVMAHQRAGHDLWLGPITVVGDAVSCGGQEVPRHGARAAVISGGELRDEVSVPAVLFLGWLGLLSRRHVDDRTLRVEVWSGGRHVAAKLSPDSLDAANAFAARLNAMEASREAQA